MLKKDKFKKYILRGQRSVRYHDGILSNTKNFYKLTQSYNFLKEQFHFHLFELEHLIELEHLPEHLIGELFGGNTMT